MDIEREDWREVGRVADEMKHASEVRPDAPAERPESAGCGCGKSDCSGHPTWREQFEMIQELGALLAAAERRADRYDGLLGHCEGCGGLEEPDPALGDGHSSGVLYPTPCGPLSEWASPSVWEKLVTAERDLAAAERSRLSWESRAAQAMKRAEDAGRDLAAARERIAQLEFVQKDHDEEEDRLEATTRTAVNHRIEEAAARDALRAALARDGAGKGGRECPKCHEGPLDVDLREYESGVVAPDGARETLTGEWARCRVCGWEGEA